MRPAHAIRTSVSRSILIALVALSGCRDKPLSESGVDPESDPLPVRLVAVQIRPADRFLEVTGTLYGQEEMLIAAKVPGRVVEIRAELGDVVAHGGMLAQIDPTDYQLAVEEQQASLSASLARIGLEALPEGEVDLSELPPVARARAEELNAAARLNRARKLYERTPPLISEQDFADITTQHEVAATSAAVELMNARSLLAEARIQASRLRTAHQRLADAMVIAPTELPLNYRVASRRVSIGEIVSQGQALFRLVASDRVKFRGFVPERYAAQVAVGIRAQVLVDAFPTPFDAVVSRVAPTVDIATRSFEVEIEASNPDGQLKPGSFVRARLLVSTEPEARFVPASAVAQFAGVQRVYSVSDGKVVEHRVRLGGPIESQYELLDALEGVDMVIDAPRGLRVGAPVSVELGSLVQ